jgi:uncharacterized SAM-binding protein YcdF (DUF218 family)
MATVPDGMNGITSQHGVRMIFVFKKIVAVLTSPVILCLDFLVPGVVLLCWTRRFRGAKVLLFMGTLLLLVLSTPAISESLLRTLEDQYRPLLVSGRSSDEALAQARYIVVLAGGYLPDPGLPPATRLRETLPRVVEGIRLFRKLGGCKLIMSGGGRPGVAAESEVMAAAAESLGIDAQRIVLESQSRDTASEAKVVRSLVGRDRFILVTAASHMPRAMALFRKQGMDPIAGPTDYLTRESLSFSPSDFVPTAAGLSASGRAIYEYLGLTWEWLRRAI